MMGNSLLQNHIEGYHELSSKTQKYLYTAVAMWDADFYIKVDDDVHVNLGLFPHLWPVFVFIFNLKLDLHIVC